jgi:hypothetical protein
MKRFAVIAGAALAVAALAGPASASKVPGSQVVVPPGQPVQIAVVLDKSLDYGTSAANAIRMAVQLTPSIKGFPVQLNDGFDGPCGADSSVVAQNAAAATAVVANPQNVAVVGHMCSYGLAAAQESGCPNPAPTTALSIYQSAGIVAINGSATAPCVASVGPTVFDRTAVADPRFDSWYATVKTLPSDELWRLIYQLEFGAPPTDFADLYFDAARLVLTRISQISQVVNGNLVIDRGALASAVRHTTRFPGVTCSITIDPATGNRLDDPGALGLCAAF